MMRSFIALSSLAVLTAGQSTTISTAIPADANPTPDALPLDFLRDAPTPSYSSTLGALSQIIPYVASTAIAAASAEQIETPLSVFPAVTSVAINAAGDDGAAPTTTSSPESQDVEGSLRKRTACQPYSTVSNGYNAKVFTGTAAYSAFKTDAAISAAASKATPPTGYYENFKNYDKANNAYAYLGYTVIKEYKPDTCAKQCNQMSGCLSFNIYFELDPSVDPATGCKPSPVINIKCAFWGSALDKSTAVNDGQWRDTFHVSIAGSNAYTSTSVGAPIAGWTGPLNLGKAVMQAPLRDSAGTWTYMGYKLFNTGPYNVTLCEAACNAQNDYNIAHPPDDGSTVPLCAAFGTYQLTQNTAAGSVIKGQMCTMYTSAWAASYATNTISFDDSLPANYTYDLSFFYASPDRQPVSAADVSYLAASGAAFCTSYISYAPSTTTTTTLLSTTTPAVSTLYATTTVMDTTTAFTATVTAETTLAADPARRRRARRSFGQPGLVPVPQTRAAATPASVATWPASRLSAACSKVATGAATATASSVVTAVAPVTTVSATVTSGVTTVLAATTVTVTVTA